MDRFRSTIRECVACEQPSGLGSLVLAGLARARRAEARRALAFYSSVITVSSVGFAYFIPILVGELAASSFGDFLSLAFSDASIVFANSREFVLLLVESLPVTTLTFASVCFAAFLYGVRRTAEISSAAFGRLAIR